MDYYKFINTNTIQKLENNYVTIDNVIYTNPTSETLKMAGYKPLNENLDNLPTTLNDGEYVDITYVDGTDEILANYTVKEYPVNDIDEIDISEFNIINQEGLGAE